MIEYISGKIAELTPATAVLETNGVGYEINITLPDHVAMCNAETARLYIHESIREDAHVLYGFLDRQTRMLFRHLIGVSGVGPGTARLILSSLTASDLMTAISTGNDAMLKAVKGIGGKTAQRIIVDLRDKINAEEIALNTKLAMPESGFDESLAALVTLGFTRDASRKALRKLYDSNPAISVEQAVGDALKML